MILFMLLMLSHFAWLKSSEDLDVFQVVKRNIKTATKCIDKPLEFSVRKRGNFWVMYNFAKASTSFKCEESVTYTTHADYTFLDNLKPLIERWKGPMSLAIYAPGEDIIPTLESIRYLRHCSSKLIPKLVSFHVYFETEEIPRFVMDPRNFRYVCPKRPPFINKTYSDTYKYQKKLLYPINVGRNIARDAAQTYFILPSDIEMYPSLNLIPKFLRMIGRNPSPILNSNPKVFPLVLFEVKDDQNIPNNKTELQTMLREGTAVQFHRDICLNCHQVPGYSEWIKEPESKDLNVFLVAKRTGIYYRWEPTYIGTNNEPYFDERLTWEGQQNKIVQTYMLCLLNYDFLILDNAFMVHKPGIKVYQSLELRENMSNLTRNLVNEVIYPELKLIYGEKTECDYSYMTFAQPLE